MAAGEAVAAIELFPGFPCMGEDIHPDVHIVENPCMELVDRGPQHPTQVLEDSSAKLDGGGEKQGGEIGGVKAFTNELAGGDEHVQRSGGKLIDHVGSLGGGEISRENGHLQFVLVLEEGF